MKKVVQRPSFFDSLDSLDSMLLSFSKSCLSIKELKNEKFQKSNAIFSGGVVKVKSYEVDTKIALYVDTFLLQL